jgi:amino acid permease
VCLLPLVIKRQLKSLTIYSFLGFMTIIYLMVVTIVSTFNPDMSNYFLEFDKIKVFELSGALTAFPVFIFSFTTQINLLQCFEELEKPTLRRMHKVLAKQHFVCFTIYLFIGVFGYLSFPLDDPNANSFIQRYDPIKHFFVLVVDSAEQAVLLLILVIFVAQPFNSLPTRESFEYFICGSNKEPSPYWLHLITSIGSVS